MVETKKLLTQGGIYLVKLDHNKTRPVVIINSQAILDSNPAMVFICHISKQSHPKFASLHVELPTRDNLSVISYALTEYCTAIAAKRIIHPRIAQITNQELSVIIRYLNRLIATKTN